MISGVTAKAQNQTSAESLQWLANCVKWSEKLRPVCAGVSAMGMFFFLIMVLVTFIDVFLRYFFNSPISGTIEITEFFMVIVFFTSVSYTQWTGGHIVMDVVTAKLSQPAQDKLMIVTTCWSVATVGACLAAMIGYTRTMDLASPVLTIPIKPFVWFAAAGLTLLLLTLLHDLCAALLKVGRSYGKLSMCIWLAVGILSTAAFIWFAMHRMRGIPAVYMGIFGICFMFFLFFSGMPVAYALMASAIVFIASMRGHMAAWNMLGTFWYSTVASYDWSPLMFFLLMGYVCFQGKFGQDLYYAARCWMGHRRGGLANGSVCACTAFGAVVGDSLAGSVAMSAIALPEMRKAKYDDALAIGALACAGTIGSLIPPSTTFILYGVLAEQSIGQLFMAGVIPGLLCMFCFIVCISIWARIDPKAAPASPKVPKKEAFLSLKAALPILGIFVLVIGGIYAGIFTATEGGGVGVFGMLLLAIVMRRMTFSKMVKALNEAGKFTAMCFALLAGANLLGSFMTMSRIPMALANQIASMSLPPMAVMVAIIVSLCILGCFIPAIPLVLICVPIFVPIAKVYAWDLIWFGVIATLVKNMACITPPFGINLFVMKGIAGVPIGTMYKAAIPYVLALFACVALIVAFPQLSLWLPSMMH